MPTDPKNWDKTPPDNSNKTKEDIIKVDINNNPLCNKGEVTNNNLMDNNNQDNISPNTTKDGKDNNNPLNTNNLIKDNHNINNKLLTNNKVPINPPIKCEIIIQIISIIK